MAHVGREYSFCSAGLISKTLVRGFQHHHNEPCWGGGRYRGLRVMTLMSTVQEIVTNALTIMSSLQPENLVVTLVKQFSQKYTEISWKHETEKLCTWFPIFISSVTSCLAPRRCSESGRAWCHCRGLCWRGFVRQTKLCSSLRWRDSRSRRSQIILMIAPSLTVPPLLMYSTRMNTCPGTFGVAVSDDLCTHIPDLHLAYLDVLC